MRRVEPPMLTCGNPACGKEFPSRYSDQTYCSRECVNAMKRVEYPTRTCTNSACGKEFVSRQNALYCSAACHHEAQRVVRIPVVCENEGCGNKFVARPGQRFCSRACARQSSAKTVEKVCENPACGQPFRTEAKNRRKKFCSPSCIAEAQSAAAVAARPVRECEHPGCSNIFQTIPSKGKRFCSTVCAKSVLDEANRKLVKVRLTCSREACGKEFEGVEGRKFCSNACAFAMRAEVSLQRRTRTCLNPRCQKVYVSKLYQPNRKFCSRACATDHMAEILSVPQQVYHCAHPTCWNFFAAYPHENRKFCSRTCVIAFSRLNAKTEPTIYRKECGICHKPFETKVKGSRFCSHACASRYTGMVIRLRRLRTKKRLCAECKKPFVYKTKRQTFCSVDCSQKHLRAVRRHRFECSPVPGRKTVERNCEHCQTPFHARVDGIRKGWGRFCSKSCSKKAQPTIATRPVTKVEITCQQCQKGFLVQKHAVGKRKFCSKECHSESQKNAPSNPFWLFRHNLRPSPLVSQAEQPEPLGSVDPHRVGDPVAE